MHRPKIDNSVSGVRSKQNLSCNWTGSADFGRIVPFHWEELLQGDHVITCKPRIEMQMLPLASPTFGKIDLYCHYFVVPLRQLQTEFYAIWSQTGEDKACELPFFTPKDLLSAYHKLTTLFPSRSRSIFKHWTSLGLPDFFRAVSTIDESTPISYFPFAAYNKIWWDFYRDPEVCRDESVSDYLAYLVGRKDLVSPSGEVVANFVSRFLSPHIRSIKNNWISDLFTSPGDFLRNNPLQDGNVNYPSGYYSVPDYLENGGSGEGLPFGHTPDGAPAPFDETSRQLRLIEALTRLSERLSLSGKREIEALFARYGVKPKWAEMNLCRYVGGAKSTVIVDNIISSADTGSDGLPLGAQAGKGYCALDNLNIEVSVDEPSILMGILSVMPHVHFVQGLSRKWQRQTLQDMFQSSLQYVGQVAVAKKEIGFNKDIYLESEGNDTFAFSDPYYEYKMGLDILAGDFLLYHNHPSVQDPDYTTKYMLSMEQYVDFDSTRDFNLDNLLIDGDKYNKIFNYLGGSVGDDVDDHFHICVDKEVIIERPMEGYAIPTLETTQDPHAKTTKLSQDVVL